MGHVRMAADSTMLRMVKRLIALSLGVQRAQLEQRTGLTWPRPFLLRPLKNQSVSRSIFERYSKCSSHSPVFRNALRLAVSIFRIVYVFYRFRRRHCGDHVEWETVSRICGKRRSYLDARFLTILTVCSVKGQRSDRDFRKIMRGG